MSDRYLNTSLSGEQPGLLLRYRRGLPGTGSDKPDGHPNWWRRWFGPLVIMVSSKPGHSTVKCPAVACERERSGLTATRTGLSLA